MLLFAVFTQSFFWYTQSFLNFKSISKGSIEYPIEMGEVVYQI